jgi:hypothetical protein
LGFGVWGLGVGVWGQTPNPQSPIPKSPIPNPHYLLINIIIIQKLKIIIIYNIEILKLKKEI